MAHALGIGRWPATGRLSLRSGAYAPISFDLGISGSERDWKIVREPVVRETRRPLEKEVSLF